MKHTDAEIIQCARRRVHYVEIQKGKRLVFGFMCLAMLLLPALGIGCVREKLGTADYAFLMDGKFAAGVLAGVLFCLWLMIGVLGTWSMYRDTFGHGLDMHRLLVKLADQKD